MKTKEERKQEARKEYKKIVKEYNKIVEEYQKKCEEIDNERETKCKVCGK